MRLALVLLIFSLAACNRQEEAVAAGNEQVVIDKANADVMAAEEAATAPDQAAP